MELRLITCWDCGFKSRWRHRYLSVVSVVCCQVVVCALCAHTLEVEDVLPRTEYIVHRIKFKQYRKQNCWLYMRLQVSVEMMVQIFQDVTSCTLQVVYWSLLYLYRARNKITQLSIPTHVQLQRHRLKFIKNHLKNSYMFRSTTIFRELQCPR